MALMRQWFGLALLAMACAWACAGGQALGADEKSQDVSAAKSELAAERTGETGSHDGEAGEKHSPANSHAVGGAHEAAGSHAGESHAAASPLTFKTDLAIWTLVVFGVLFLVLRKFAWGPISEALDQREKGISDNIAAAQKAHDDAKQLLADYDQKLSSAQAEVRAILDEARRDAEHTQQEILAKARAEAAAEVARGKREIESAASQAMSELAQTSADLAVNLAGKIVRAQLSPADHAQLIDDALGEFSRRAPSNN